MTENVGSGLMQDLPAKDRPQNNHSRVFRSATGPNCLIIFATCAVASDQSFGKVPYSVVGASGIGLFATRYAENTLDKAIRNPG